MMFCVLVAVEAMRELLPVTDDQMLATGLKAHGMFPQFDHATLAACIAEARIWIATPFGNAFVERELNQLARPLSPFRPRPL
jgi:hypothetical protein